MKNMFSNLEVISVEMARSLRVILSSLKNGTVELTTIFRYNNG